MYILLAFFLGFLGLAVLHTVLREGKWVNPRNLPFSLVRRLGEATFKQFYYTMGWLAAVCYDWVAYMIYFVLRNIFDVISRTVTDIGNAIMPYVAIWEIWNGFAGYMNRIWNASYEYLTSPVVGVVVVVAALAFSWWYMF